MHDVQHLLWQESLICCLALQENAMLPKLYGDSPVPTPQVKLDVATEKLCSPPSGACEGRPCQSSFLLLEQIGLVPLVKARAIAVETGLHKPFLFLCRAAKWSDNSQNGVTIQVRADEK